MSSKILLSVYTTWEKYMADINLMYTSDYFKGEVKCFWSLIDIWHGSIFFFITVQIILVVGFCGRSVFGVYEHFGFFSFWVVRWVPSLVEMGTELAFRAVVFTWGVCLISWNLHFKGGIWKLTFLEAFFLLLSLWKWYSTISCQYTQLLEKLVESNWFRKLSKQFQKLCTISSAVCHHQSKQLIRSKLAFGDVGIQLKVQSCHSFEANMKVKRFSVSSSICSTRVARKWRTYQWGGNTEHIYCT